MHVIYRRTLWIITDKWCKNCDIISPVECNLEPVSCVRQDKCECVLLHTSDCPKGPFGRNAHHQISESNNNQHCLVL